LAEDILDEAFADLCICHDAVMEAREEFFAVTGDQEDDDAD
jgi:hypothetical protein